MGINDTEQFIACPSCGALGQVGNNCPFCGSTITCDSHNEAYCLSKVLIDKRRSISDNEFAEKVAHYSVGSFERPGVAIVRIGSQYGLININGDVIVPILYEDIILKNERWLFLREENEYILYDLAKGRIINGFKTYKDHFSVIEGVEGEIVIQAYEEKEIKKWDGDSNYTQRAKDHNKEIKYQERYPGQLSHYYMDIYLLRSVTVDCNYQSYIITEAEGNVSWKLDGKISKEVCFNLYYNEIKHIHEDTNSNIWGNTVYRSIYSADGDKLMDGRIEIEMREQKRMASILYRNNIKGILDKRSTCLFDIDSYPEVTERTSAFIAYIKETISVIEQQFEEEERERQKRLRERQVSESELQKSRKEREEFERKKIRLFKLFK